MTGGEMAAIIAATITSTASLFGVLLSLWVSRSTQREIRDLDLRQDKRTRALEIEASVQSERLRASLAQETARASDFVVERRKAAATLYQAAFEATTATQALHYTMFNPDGRDWSASGQVSARVDAVRAASGHLLSTVGLALYFESGIEPVAITVRGIAEAHARRCLELVAAVEAGEVDNHEEIAALSELINRQAKELGKLQAALREIIRPAPHAGSTVGSDAEHHDQRTARQIAPSHELDEEAQAISEALPAAGTLGAAREGD